MNLFPRAAAYARSVRRPPSPVGRTDILQRWSGLLVVLLLPGCHSADNVSPSPIRVLFEQALTMRDTMVLRHAVGASLIFHARGGTDTVTRAQLWQMSQPILTAFPDIRFQVEDELRQGDKVAARVVFTGTQRGPWNGLQASGRSVRVSEMFICRLRDGQLVECWQEWDEYGLRRQLGAP